MIKKPQKGRDLMKTASRVTLSLGAGIFTLIALSGERTYAQANNPSTYPNPYQLEEDWAKLPPGRTWGSTIGIEVDPDGKSLWTFDRCAALTSRPEYRARHRPHGRLHRTAAHRAEVGHRDEGPQAFQVHSAYLQIA
jgi:hypothetical protein